MRVSHGTSDFCRAIRYRGRRFATGERVRRHRADRRHIKHELERARRAGETVVVVTHHAPSPQCIRPWFQGDPFNPAFASNLDPLIERCEPSLWIHGHMHDPVGERMGKTRILANPAGYRHKNKRGFNPGLCVEVDDATAQQPDPDTHQGSVRCRTRKVRPRGRSGCERRPRRVPGSSASRR